MSVPPPYIVLVSTSKRPYLADLQPFTVVFSLKNFGLQVLKAALIPLNSIVNEYNVYTIKAAQEDEGDIEEFDWNAAYQRHIPSFLPSLLRNITISVVKRFMEETALRFLPLRVVDRLTKNVGKSALRKFAKYNSKWIACSKLFFTALWGNVTFNATSLLYDIGLRLCNDIQLVYHDCVDFWHNHARKLVAFIAKKGLYYAVCGVSSAAGYALGSLLNASFGGSIGSMLMEVTAASLCATALDL